MFAEYTPYILLFSVLFVLFVIFIVLFSFIYLWYKSRQHLNNALNNGSDLVFFKVAVPEATEVEMKSMEQFYTNLLGLKDIGNFGVNKSEHISLEIVGSEEGIDFYIVCNKKTESLVEKAIHAVYAEAEITKGKQNIWNIWEKEGYQEFGEYYLSKDDYYPIQTYEEIELDPLNSITSVLSKMSSGEGMAIQLLIRPANSNWQDAGNGTASYLTNKKDKDGNITSTDKDREKAEVIKNKIKKEGFEFVIRTFSVAPTKELAKANLKNLKNAISVLDNPQGNKISSKPIKDIPFLTDGKKNFLCAFMWRVFPYYHLEIPILKKTLAKGYSVLNTKELATFYHLPNNNVKTPGINWLRAKSHIAPSDLPESGMYLGYSEFRGVERKIFMSADDRRRHMYIIGQTGTGKSELMKFLAIQDIKAGKGVAFMDPHGSAVQDILLQIPPERIDDVIYFNPGDEDYPMGLNLLDVKTPRARDLVINSFIELLYKLYDPNHQGIVGPQLERAVRNSMLTIMEAVDGGTMVEVMRLVIDEKYQKSLLEKVKDPMVRRYWTDEMANTQAFHKSEKTGYFVSKFDKFVTDRIMRNIIGQSKSAFDFGEVMKNKKILLIDLNKGILGEESSKFLGLLLIPRILGAAFARANPVDGVKEDFDDFYLYVDEFQNFSTPDFVTILSEARKYKLNLTVANQFLGQMTDDIKNAIFGNVGTLVSFRVGQDDGKYMSEQFSPYFNETDMINLKVGTAVLRLLVGGHPTPPFSLKTDWPLMSSAVRSKEVADQVVKLSRQKYAKTAAEVEKEMDERSGLSKVEEKPNPFGSPFASPFASPAGGFGKPSPFAKPNDDEPFGSGKTPFSSDKKPASPFSRPMNPFPSPFANNPGAFNRPVVNNTNAPFNSPVTQPRPFPSTFKPIGGERPLNPADSKDINNFDNNNAGFGAANSGMGGFNNNFGQNAFNTPRPFNAQEGGANKQTAKRGTISLADLDKPIEKKDFTQGNSFNNTNQIPPLRPTFTPKVIEDNRPKAPDQTQPKGTISLE